MSSEGERPSRLLLPLSRGYVARLLGAVLSSVVALLYAGSFGPDAAFLEFLGGGLLVPDQLGTRPSVVFLIAWIAPLAIFDYLFSDFLSGQLDRDAAAILPRVRSRGRWTAGRLVQLAFFSTAFAVVGPLLGTVGLCAMHPGAVSAAHVGVAAASALISVPLVYLLALATNCVALRTDALVAFASLICAHVGTLVVMAYLPYELALAVAPWLPSAQGVLAWHDCSGWCSLLEAGVPGFGLVPSFVYLFVCVALALVASVRLVCADDVI